MLLEECPPGFSRAPSLGLQTGRTPKLQLPPDKGLGLVRPVSVSLFPSIIYVILPAILIGAAM